MFENFKFGFTETSAVENRLIEMKSIPFKYSELLLALGGTSYNKGAYTIHTFTDSIRWTEILSNIFVKYQGNFLSFAHDWMGRHYCVSKNVGECVYVFDPYTFEDFYIGTNLFDFHNSILCDSTADVLLLSTFEGVRQYLNVTEFTQSQCIGLKIPLFLNGELDNSNYDVYDLEFYWDIENQLYQQAKNFPDGTRINAVAINPITKKG